MVTSDRLGNIFLKDDVVEFPATKVGKTKEMKFRLCNDGTEVTRIRLSGFHSPFSVVEKHTKLFLKPKSYIRVPVTFTLTVANSSFTGLIIVSLDNQQQNGGNICVQLNGTSSF
uniref:Cep192-like domain-containing protein n=2 Tax=Clytia hemisphaerica TaxID=252671 RepID=A0A7M5XCG3_9CNID